MKNHTDFHTARQEGAEAHANGKRVSDCPYRLGSSSMFDWIEGFNTEVEKTLKRLQGQK